MIDISELKHGLAWSDDNAVGMTLDGAEVTVLRAALDAAEAEIAQIRAQLAGAVDREAAAYRQGVAHARHVVEQHYDWNPETIRADLLLNIDMGCTGPFLPDALPALAPNRTAPDLAAVREDGA